MPSVLTWLASGGTVRQCEIDSAPQFASGAVKVKRLTRAGQSLQVTDNGKPFWVIHPAPQEQDDEERARSIDELLDEALRSPRSPISTAALLEESRR
jgi:hypothetical protein